MKHLPAFTIICLLAGLALLLGRGASLIAADLPSLATNQSSNLLSLDEVVSAVLCENPESAFYRSAIAAAKAGRKTAGEWSNPELNTEFGSKRVWERGSGVTLGDGLVWSVGVAQSFEWPGRMALRKTIANGQVAAAELGLAQFEAALAAKVRSLGYAVLVSQEKAAAAREVSRRFQALLEVLVQREPAGVTPLLDQRIIESTAITLHRRAAQADQALHSALIALNQLRGQPSTTPLRITGGVTLSTNVPPLTILLDTAGTNNFEIRMRQLELTQQGFQVQLARNERWPKVTLAPFYASEKANDEQRIVGVGVSLPVPLWNRNKGGVEAAEARLQQAQASWRVTCRQVERQVAEHAVALQANVEELNRWHPDAQRQFREAAELADRHYRLGAVPVTTYVEMQTRYLDALEALLTAKAEALEHRQELELLTGRKLSDFTP